MLIIKKRRWRVRACQLLDSVCQRFLAILSLLEAVQYVQKAAVHLCVRRSVRQKVWPAALVIHRRDHLRGYVMLRALHTNVGCISTHADHWRTCIQALPGAASARAAKMADLHTCPVLSLLCRVDVPEQDWCNQVSWRADMRSRARGKSSTTLKATTSTLSCSCHCKCTSAS